MSTKIYLYVNIFSLDLVSYEKREKKKVIGL